MRETVIVEVNASDSNEKMALVTELISKMSIGDLQAIASFASHLYETAEFRESDRC